MAITIGGIPASGLQVDRMMTTAYLEGRTKVNGTRSAYRKADAA